MLVRGRVMVAAVLAELDVYRLRPPVVPHDDHHQEAGGEDCGQLRATQSGQGVSAGGEQGDYRQAREQQDDDGDQDHAGTVAFVSAQAELHSGGAPHDGQQHEAPDHDAGEGEDRPPEGRGDDGRGVAAMDTNGPVDRDRSDEENKGGGTSRSGQEDQEPCPSLAA